MFDFAPEITAAALILLGLITAAGLLLFLRAARREHGSVPAESSPGHFDALPDDSGHGAILVSSSGHILHANPIVRSWLHLPEDATLNLEFLSGRAEPAEAFMELCAAPGSQRFTLQGLEIDGRSHRLVFRDEQALLVVLQRPTPAVLNGSGSPGAAPTGLVGEISAAIGSQADLNDTIEAILEKVGRLVPADVAEITVLDEAEDVLVPYRLSGPPNPARTLDIPEERYPRHSGWSGALVRERAAIVHNPGQNGQDGRREHGKPYPFQAYIGVPLQIGDAVIGTLELASLTERTYSREDLATLERLSGQAAFSLQYALTQAVENRRVEELTGLAALTQVVGALQDPQDLVAQLLASMLPLLDVELLGFLLYDENTHTLEAARPFEGLPDDYARSVSAAIEPGSPAAELLLSNETIIAHPAADDPRLATLHLDGVVGATDIASMVLAPLWLGGHSLGYLLAANRRGGGAFPADELRILSIIAGQAAASIENTRLLEESRRRRRQAEALRRIAAIAGSAATLTEILSFSLTEIARLLSAETGAIFLVDEGEYTLRLHAESVFGVAAGRISGQLDLKLEDPGYAHTVTGSQQARSFVRHSAALEGQPIYKSLVEQLDVESALSVPLVVSARSFGEIVFGSRSEEAFGAGEIELASTAAGQIAGAIERALVKTESDETLRRRVEELTALTRISRELNTSFDLEGLLQLIHGEALATTGADCGAIFLLDFEDALNPEPAITLLAGDTRENDQLSTVELAVIRDNQAPVIADFTAKDSPAPPHAGVTAAMILPIRFQDEMIGLFNLHTKKNTAFDQATLESAEALAVQAGIALGNAVRFREQIVSSRQIQRRYDALTRLFDLHRELENTQPDLPDALHRIAQGLSASMRFDVVIISAFDPEGRSLERMAAHGFTREAFDELQQVHIPWSNVEALTRPEFRYQDVYFIPADRVPMVPPEFDLILTLDPAEDRQERSAWQAQDLLFVPLYDPEGEPLGVISVDAPANRQRPDQADFEILALFADQAARLMLNARAAGREKTVAQDRDAAALADGESPAEPGDAFPALRRESRLRIGAVLEIVEHLNGLTRRAQVFESISQDLVEQLGCDFSFIAEPSADGVHLAAQAGAAPPDVNTEALLGQRNPLRSTLHTGEMLLAENIQEGADTGWQQAPLLNQLGAASFFSIPILDPDSETEIEGALLGLSRSPQPPFTADDREILLLLGRQIAAALQRIAQMEETRERLREVDLLLNFSRRLGSLNKSEILRSLTENAMEVCENAQAAMVALWNPVSERLSPANPTGYPDNAAMQAVRFPADSTLPGLVFSEGTSRRVSELNIAEAYPLPYEDLMKYQAATRRQVPVSSLVVPIRSAKAGLGVLVLDSFTEPDGFTVEEEALISSLARQTGLILENATLLEEANRRTIQLESLTGVATTITSDLQVERITSSLLDHLMRVIPFDTGTFWFRQGQALSIRAAQGFSDDEERTGLTVSIEDSHLLRDMVASGRPINVADVSEDDRFVSPDGFAHRSWLGIPLIAKGEVVGVIALEKTEAGYYDPEHIQIATTFAGQAAVALENARLFEESLQRTETLNERTKRLDLLNSLSTTFSATLDTRYILQFTADRMREAFDCLAVSAVRIDDAGNALLTAESPGPEEGAAEIDFDDTPFKQLRESLGVQIIEDVREAPELAPLADFWSAHGTQAAAAISLAAAGELHGLMILHGEERLSAGEIDLARTIGNQAGIAIQNARLFDRSRELTEDLERRVEARTRELELAHERTETMLGIITELSASLDMDIVLSRTLTLINRIVGAEQSTIIISNPADERSMRRSAQDYSAPAEQGPETVSRVLNEKLAAAVIGSREPVLIDDLSEAEQWRGLQLNSQRSAIAMPLMLGAEALGALMLFHREPARFSEHHLDLIQSAARQVAIAVNNAHLYLLIRDQAERLGGMLRSQQIEASRLLAILESVVDGVIVTDAAGEISVFNRAAEQILQLGPEDVVGRSLDAFSGLFGRAGQTWMETIRTWLADPEDFDPNETFSEEIVLDDDRVLAVNLSPVYTPQEFLGTVSIFRDITHLIEVDRLKSEFVATVSHELRTPLTSIKGYVDVLLMGAAGDLDDQQRRFLEIAQDNTERLNTLVDDLLEVSRIEAGKISLDLQAVDIPALANDLATDYTLRAQEEKKSMSIRIEDGEHIPHALADPARVRQILDNLVGNAYNYTLDEGQIGVSFRTNGAQLEVHVSDNGVGIPPEEQEQIFERFYRGEAPLTTSIAGTGLGLSIVRHLVELHGGTIRLQSRGVPGEGSTFIFTLPVFPEEAGTPD